MSDSPIVSIFLACIVAVAVGFLAYEDGRKSVGRDCDAMNSFHIGGKAYQCRSAVKETSNAS